MELLKLKTIEVKCLFYSIMLRNMILRKNTTTKCYIYWTEVGVTVWIWVCMVQENRMIHFNYYEHTHTHDFYVFCLHAPLFLPIWHVTVGSFLATDKWILILNRCRQSLFAFYLFWITPFIRFIQHGQMLGIIEVQNIWKAPNFIKIRTI